jgi:hypothetical protein
VVTINDRDKGIDNAEIKTKYTKAETKTKTSVKRGKLRQ